MSALTDLFTNLASKIRVKLGTTDKYTPTQAVAAIDQIYDKGVTSAKVGTATAAVVLKGKTFTNASSIGATGTMPDYSTSSRKQVVWGTGSGNTTPAMRLDTDGANYSIAVPKGYWNWSYDNSSITIPAETKTWTPAGATTLTPTNGKMIKSVTVNAVPTVTTTVTPKTTAQTVTPVSGKYFSKVTVNAIATQNKTVTAGASNTTVATNGYIVNTIVKPTPTTTVTVTPKTSTQSLTPADGYHYSKVTVKAVELDGNAGVSHVLNGKTFYTTSLTQKTGTMTNHGSISTTLKPNGSKSFTAGYHSASTFSAAPCTGTYTYGTGSTGAKYDMGAANVYRYVVATNVYNQGKEDGAKTTTAGQGIHSNDSSDTYVEKKTFTLPPGSYRLVAMIKRYASYNPPIIFKGGTKDISWYNSEDNIVFYDSGTFKFTSATPCTMKTSPVHNAGMAFAIGYIYKV